MCKCSVFVSLQDESYKKLKSICSCYYYLSVFIILLFLYNVAFCASLQTYKPPTSKDIPLDMRVHLKHEAVNPIGFVRSKGRQLD